MPQQIATPKSQATNQIPNRKIILTIPEQMVKILLKEKEKYIYNSIQEIILETLRNKYVKSNSNSRTKRGRPKKTNPEDVLSRRNIFVKKGGEVVDV